MPGRHLRSRLLILASLGVPDRASGCRCFCKGTRKYNTPASNKRQVPFFCLLLAFLSCTWPFMGWRFVAGSTFHVCRGCSIWIFFRNGVHVALTIRAHVKSCSFSWRESTTLMFLALLTCVYLRFSCWTPGVAFEPDCWGYDLLYFPSNQETKTEKVLYPRCVQKFEYDVGQCCFRISPVLGSMEFSVGFWPPSSFASATQVGFMQGPTSSPLEDPSPWAIHLPKILEVHCP